MQEKFKTVLTVSMIVIVGQILATSVFFSLGEVTDLWRLLDIALLLGVAARLLVAEPHDVHDEGFQRSVGVIVVMFAVYITAYDTVNGPIPYFWIGTVFAGVPIIADMFNSDLWVKGKRLHVPLFLIWAIPQIGIIAAASHAAGLT